MDEQTIDVTAIVLGSTGSMLPSFELGDMR
jgi:hypothetical protein